ncbi:hypothetical protein GA0070216_105214 [Micromonospora matsumotoense]|uniref:Uncharacterized protein n=1 Tax=Micromonospora matsumotoense TaxID=121616 RepID=A0A1C4XWT3_9ACTN|nr:hypothetical protein [Micromonospora matsumotoense]SCF12786.1 hypothetical protein GA0070216_105214 [Micromonospora matsumotoense]
MSHAPSMLAPRGPLPRSRPLVISAWAVTVLVAVQFAMVAVVPVAITLVTVLRNDALRPLRWWAVTLGTAYGAGLALWAIGPDRAPSLSKNLHPGHEVAIVVLGIALAIAYHALRRRPCAR